MLAAPEPTPHDHKNARSRAEIAARQQAEYAMELTAFGAGWLLGRARWYWDRLRFLVWGSSANDKEGRIFPGCHEDRGDGNLFFSTHKLMRKRSVCSFRISQLNMTQIQPGNI
jgi:hypothetical protein